MVFLYQKGQQGAERDLRLMRPMNSEEHLAGAQPCGVSPGSRSLWDDLALLSSSLRAK